MYSILHKIFMNSAAVYYIIMSWYTWIYLHTIYLIIIKDCLYQKLCCFVFFDTWTKKTHPVPVSSSDKKSMPPPPPHCSHLVSVPLPVFKFFFYRKTVVYQCILSCLTSAEHSGCHTWVTDRGLGEDGKFECKHSLSLHCHTEGGTLSVSVWGWDHRIRMCLTLLVIV